MVIEAMVAMGLLFLISFGMVEFGYSFYCKSMLTAAAREGARTAAMTGSNNSDVSKAVDKALSGTGWASNKYTVDVTDTSNNAVNAQNVSAGTAIQVTVSATWGTLGSGMRPMKLIPTTKVIAGVCTMRKES